MKIIQASKIIFFCFFVSSLYQASSSVLLEGPSKSHMVSTSPSKSIILDEEPSSDTTLRTSHYDAEEIIGEIQRSTKPFYTNDHLSVDGEIFEAIKNKDKKITQLFRTALQKFEKPEGETWNCWPIMSKGKTRIIIHISDPQ